MKSEHTHLLHIQADYNDADYVTEETKVGAETIALVRKVCALIKEKNLEYGHNWDRMGEVRTDYSELTHEEFRRFDAMVPFAGENYVHTITKVELRPLEYERLL